MSATTETKPAIDLQYQQSPRPQQDKERWKDTLDALDSVKAGRTIPAQEVSEWLQSIGTENRKPPPTI